MRFPIEPVARSGRSGRCLGVALTIGGAVLFQVVSLPSGVVVTSVPSFTLYRSSRVKFVESKYCFILPLDAKDAKTKDTLEKIAH